MHIGALGYGLLLGCIGAGGVIGAAIMPRVQRALPVVDQRVAFSTVALALVMVALGNLRTLWLLCLITTGGGVAR